MNSIRYYGLFCLQVLRILTFARIWNICKLHITFILSRYFKIHITNVLPSYVSIEPTNICNLHCPECPTGNNSSTVEKGKLSIPLLQKILPQIASKAFFVNVYFQGEPFIHEKLSDIVSEISRFKMLSSLSTNAHFITKENAQSIVKAGLTKIIISLDGYNQETYEIYRKNGNFDKVIQGLEYITTAKKELKSNFPLVELQCLLFKHTEHSKEKIQEIGNTYSVDIVTFKTVQLYDTENLDLLPSQKNSRYILQNGKLELAGPIKNSCWRMWSSIVISWQGNVIPCCFDKNHDFAYGNCNDISIKEIQNSIITKNFKTKVHSQRKNIKMCRNCTS